MDKQDSEPTKDDQENVVGQSQTQVGAPDSQGLSNQPSSSVTQNNINTQGGDYAAGNIDKRSGTFNIGSTVSSNNDLMANGDVIGGDKITYIYQSIRLPSTPLFNAPDLPFQFSSLKTLDAKLTNLPAQPTPFIGRERELAVILNLLRRADVRLVTLTGPGGTGKTRLSLQAAADLLDEYKHGVFSVPLQTITDPNLVIPTIASVLNLRESGGQSADVRLKHYLAEKHLLLVLDNLEQVISAAPKIGELLSAAPHLKIVTSSREKLHVYGEHEYPVPPLALPDLKKKSSVTARSVSQYAAVALFIQRAKAANPNFEITDQNAPAVAEICVRLDGLPLAIELAAARAKLLTPQMLLEKLASRLKILKGGARDLPARHQTIRGTIDWSYNLLDEGEKRLFARLGVFVGGWTLEEAEAVCGENLPLEVFDGLESLADKSLIRQVEGASDEPRFTMLETLREYAQEKLVEAGEGETIRDRHLDYFLKLAEEAEPELRGPEQVAWLDRLEAELDNLRTALDWSLKSNVEAGLRLTAALLWLWQIRGYSEEGCGWLERMLEVEALEHGQTGQPRSSARTLTRAKALCVAGWLVLVTPGGDVERARALEDESLTLYQAVGSAGKRGVTQARFHLAYCAVRQLDYDRGIVLAQEALISFRELNDKYSIAQALNGLLGPVAMLQGNYEQSRAFQEEALTLGKEIGNKEGIAWTLRCLGDVAFLQHELAQAKMFYQEALSIFQEVRDKGGHSESMFVGLGIVALHESDYEQAQTLVEKALSLATERADKRNMSDCLLWLGMLALRQGNYQQATDFYTQALRLTHELGNKIAMNYAGVGLGFAALYQEDSERAATLFKENLPLLQETNEKYGIAHCLYGLAALAITQSRWKLAGCLFSVAGTTVQSLPGLPVFPPAPTQHNHYMRTLHAHLDEDSFAAAWAEGRAMTLEQAVAYALED